MVYRSLFPRDIFAEMDRMQRMMEQVFRNGPSIRGRGFPAINIGDTPQAVEVYIFAPGLDPAALEVQLDKNTLTIAGERQAAEAEEGATRHIDERFAGRFRRVLSLPDDIDPNRATATYRDGVLHVRIPRTAEAEPRRITVQ